MKHHKMRAARFLGPVQKHQLRVAYATLKLTDEAVPIMGGPSKSKAREIIFRLTGKEVKEDHYEQKNS